MDGIFRAHKFVGLVPNTSLACFQQGKQLHILRYDIFGCVIRPRNVDSPLMTTL